MNQNKDELSPSEQSDRDWLAFRYIAGEISDSERNEFEARLATDQSAREAVAAAVHLTQTVARSEVYVQPVVRSAERTRGGNWRRTTWVTTAVTTCLAIVLGYQVVSKLVREAEKDPSSFGSRENANRLDDPLAQAWIEASEESSELVSFESKFDEVPVESMEDDENAHLEEASIEAPDWMLSAVSGIVKSSKARQ